jgi:hypothetical protein
VFDEDNECQDDEDDEDDEHDGGGSQRFIVVRHLVRRDETRKSCSRK